MLRNHCLFRSREIQSVYPEALLLNRSNGGNVINDGSANVGGISDGGDVAGDVSDCCGADVSDVRNGGDDAGGLSDDPSDVSDYCDADVGVVRDEGGDAAGDVSDHDDARQCVVLAMVVSMADGGLARWQ